MNLSFSFRYHKDLIKVWPLIWFLRLIGKTGNDYCFHSESYGDYFNHFHEYWQQVGKKTALLEVIQRQKGLSVDGRSFNEVLIQYCKAKYPGKAVVVTFDMNMESLLRTLGKLQGVDKKLFLEDVLFFSFSTREEALKLARAMPSSLGEKVVVYDGQEVPVNQGSTGWSNM